MKKIEAISHILAYEPNNFIKQVIDTTSNMENKGLEVDIQYSSANEIYTALVIGRKVEKNERTYSSKTIRQTLQDKKS